MPINNDYMREPLKALLRHQARLGQNVVLMSATLPSRIRDELVAAFAGGARWHTPRLPPARYPALHVLHAGGVEHRAPTGSPPHRAPPVRFEPVHTEAEVLKRVEAWSRDGRCVLWIRNTVDEAVRGFDGLCERLGDRVLLYHARFLPKDRARAEHRLIKALGRDSGPEQRRGFVVVATQVAEQSLDLDADELVTDVAPVDAILQRLGRRRRHPRDAQGVRVPGGADARPSSPVLLHTPPLENSGADWLARFSPGSARIYSDIGRVWLGASLLIDPTQLPGHHSASIDPLADAKPLVEAVYTEDGALRSILPTALYDSLASAAGSACAAKDAGRRAALAFRDGIYRDWGQADGSPDTDDIATTRLGESHEHLLVVETSAGLSFLCSDGDPLETSVVRYYRRVDSLGENDPRRRCLLADLPAQLRRRAEGQPMLLLAPDDAGGWSGRGCSDARDVRVFYDETRGLRLERI